MSLPSTLYEDAQLLIVDKPAGILVHRSPGAGDYPDAVSLLQQARGNRLMPAHRLDRQTSGVLVFAKDQDTARQCRSDIDAGLWQKRYTALCRSPFERSFIVDRPVPEDKKRRAAQTMFHPITGFRNRYMLIHAEPRTGRRHQIRYHLKVARHHLVGDTTYGRGEINRFFRETFRLHRHFLHASTLRLPAPDGSKMLEIDAPLDQDLQRVLSELDAYQGPVA